MKATPNRFQMWQRSSWPYWIYAKCMFTIQPYRDDTFEATQIIPNLWVGDIRSACNESSLKENNIDMIISAVYGAIAHYPFKFKYEKADLRDLGNENIIGEIDRLLPRIRDEINQNKGVLIHCMQGASRSVTIAAAYLIRYHNMLAAEALEFMKRKRSCVNPNKGYRNQLRTYEDMIFKEKEERIRLAKDKKDK